MKSVLAIILLFWLLFSVSSLVLNITELFSEEKIYFSATEDEKRKLLYGDSHLIYTFLLNQVKEIDNILLFSSSGKTFFLGRYYLYPKKIYWAAEKRNMTTDKIKRYAYVLVYYSKDENINIELNNIEGLRVAKKASIVDERDNLIAVLYKVL